MTTNQQRRDSRAKMLTPTFIMGDVHEDVFKSVFARSVYSYGSLAQRARPFPPVTTYRLDKMSGFSEVNVKTIGTILRGLYDWGFLTPFVRASKTRATITPKGWAYVFFYLNRGDFTDDRFKPFIGSANDGPYVFAGFVKDTGLPDLWFAKLCRDVWDHEESFKPEARRRPWPWPQDNGASVVDGLTVVEPDKGAAPLRPSEAGQFMPCLGDQPEHPIDAIIETRSPRMTDEEVEALYLKRAEDPAQVEIARVLLAREYRKDTRFADMQEVNGLIKEHLTPVETLRFEHRRMWEGPAVGIETLVERMSKAGQFKPTTLADMAPNRLGISDMDASGHGVSKIAAALRLDEEAAAARNLGTDGQTTLGEAGISLTPPEPAGEETRARLIETLKRIDDGVYDCLADQADAILAALSPEAPAREGAVRPVIEKLADDVAKLVLHGKVPIDRALKTHITKAVNALTPRHEATAEPCFECGSTERTGTACKPCNPEITNPNFGHEAPAEAPPANANEVPGSTWYSGHKLHIVRGEGSDKRALTLAGQPLVVDFIIDSDYDEQHVAYLEREVDHLMDKMNLPHDVQYYRQIDEDMKLLHNKRGYTREHQRVGELEHTVTTVGPAWADAIVAGLIGAAIVLAGLGLGLWSGLLVIAS